MLPDGERHPDLLSADASGVVGGDVRAGLDALAFRDGLAHPDDVEVNAAFTAAMLAGQAGRGRGAAGRVRRRRPLDLVARHAAP